MKQGIKHENCETSDGTSCRKDPKWNTSHDMKTDQYQHATQFEPRGGQKYYYFLYQMLICKTLKHAQHYNNSINEVNLA